MEAIPGWLRWTWESTDVYGNVPVFVWIQGMESFDFTRRKTRMTIETQAFWRCVSY